MKMPVTSLDTDLQHAIEVCETCHNTCIETVMHCLTVGGECADPNHVRLLLDCSEISQASAHALRVNPEASGETFAMCAVVADFCARECAQLEDDPQLVACALACQRCAAICQEMARIPEHVFEALAVYA